VYKVILEFWELDLSYLCNLRGPAEIASISLKIEEELRRSTNLTLG